MVHFVGSIPGTDVEDVMRTILSRTGTSVRSLPDGEIGERSRWIIPVVDSLSYHPDLEQVRFGGWRSYDDLPRYRIRRGHQFDSAHIDLPQSMMFEQAYPIFKRIRDQFGLAELSFQVGLPGDLDYALPTFGSIGGFRHRRPFAEALGRQMQAIHADGGDDVIFQLELPAELVLMTRTPTPLRPIAAALLTRGVVALAQRAPAASRFGIHLCLGDNNHRSVVRLRNVKPLVHLVNALVARWPADRPLEFVHVPLAAADEPPSVSPRFYRALRQLKLPAEVRFIAGLVHEDLDLDQLRGIRDLVEEQLGRQVDLAASCGLGRRSAEQADRTIDLARRLTDL
ncbi:hypothetical protein F3087_40045 [Nocardia colli]|uniref:Cobalamin-independent methionine synthase MetE C-terminal/archaeal domain-containing protein n=1 Tax=Nocardia colli TaxID=2545717 RepID=A0A5N0DYU5_9NOCA|nr:hypothetical protein [Nocardia colli]KAA8881866.1 hypothetical protein F3087_40045 [Nocardia colli]